MADRPPTGKLHPVFRVLSGIIFALSMIGLGALLRSMWTEGVDADLWPQLLLMLAFSVATIYVAGYVLFSGRQPPFMDYLDKFLAYLDKVGRRDR